MGIELLDEVNGLIVQQTKTATEAIVGFERKNYYDIESLAGEHLFDAKEVGADYDLKKAMLQEHRSFQVNIFEPGGAILLRCIRETNVRDMFDSIKSGKLPYRRLEVFDKRADLVGSIVQKFNLIRSVYEINDHNDRLLFTARSTPLLPIIFDVRTRTRSVGGVRKRYRNILAELFTKSDTYEVTFQSGVDAPKRALILAMVFLIDFNLFESRDN